MAFEQTPLGDLVIVNDSSFSWNELIEMSSNSHFDLEGFVFVFFNFEFSRKNIIWLDLKISCTFSLEDFLSKFSLKPNNSLNFKNLSKIKNTGIQTSKKDGLGVSSSKEAAALTLSIWFSFIKCEISSSYFVFLSFSDLS